HTRSKRDWSSDVCSSDLFSKKLIEADISHKESTKKHNIITVTNNFHVFRALLWARKVQLKSDGAGAKTKFYFWLNALIREFIGEIGRASCREGVWIWEVG